MAQQNMGSTRIDVEACAERASSPIYHQGGSTDDNDQTSDGRARGCRNGGYAPCSASEESQAHQASNLLSDVHIRPLSDGRSVGSAERRLWHIRNCRGNRHCSVNRHIQLAFGRRHQRSPYLEQHHARRSLGECRLAGSRRVALTHKGRSRRTAGHASIWAYIGRCHATSTTRSLIRWATSL
jgi:hypothetical protein